MKRLVPERVQGVKKEQAKEGEGGLAKDGVLLQQDICLFLGKKAKIAPNETQEKAREQPIQKKRKVVKKVKEPMRAAGLETGSVGQTEPEA